jgi:hypothetical protein
MTLLLMLDFDPHLVSAVTRTLRQHAIAVVGVTAVHEAYERATTQPFDAGLLDGDVLSRGELDAFGSLPLVLTTTFLEPVWDRWFSERPILHKPFTSAQLLSVLGDTLDALRPRSASVVDLLRRAHSAGRSVAYRVGRGEVFLEGGELVHAELDGIRGEAALSHVLAEVDPLVVRIADRAVERSIHRPFRTLLLDLLRRIEEREEGPARYLRRTGPRLRLVRGGPQS